MTLDGSCFCNGWKIFDDATFGHVDDCVDGDMAKTDVDVSEDVMVGHGCLLSKRESIDGWEKIGGGTCHDLKV